MQKLLEKPFLSLGKRSAHCQMGGRGLHLLIVKCDWKALLQHSEVVQLAQEKELVSDLKKACWL